jgi:hypothetical protein
MTDLTEAPKAHSCSANIQKTLCECFQNVKFHNSPLLKNQKGQNNTTSKFYSAQTDSTMSISGNKSKVLDELARNSST